MLVQKIDAVIIKYIEWEPAYHRKVYIYFPHNREINYAKTDQCQFLGIEVYRYCLMVIQRILAELAVRSPGGMEVSCSAIISFQMRVYERFVKILYHTRPLLIMAYVDQTGGQIYRRQSMNICMHTCGCVYI